MRVWTVGAGEVESLRPRLGEILVDCVGAGASVGFLDPLDPAEADAYWQRIERAVGDGRVVLLVGALDGDARRGRRNGAARRRHAPEPAAPGDGQQAPRPHVGADGTGSARR